MKLPILAFSLFLALTGIAFGQNGHVAADGSCQPIGASCSISSAPCPRLDPAEEQAFFGTTVMCTIPTRKEPVLLGGSVYNAWLWEHPKLSSICQSSDPAACRKQGFKRMVVDVPPEETRLGNLCELKNGTIIRAVDAKKDDILVGCFSSQGINPHCLESPQVCGIDAPPECDSLHSPCSSTYGINIHCDAGIGPDCGAQWCKYDSTETNFDCKPYLPDKPPLVKVCSPYPCEPDNAAHAGPDSYIDVHPYTNDHMLCGNVHTGKNEPCPYWAAKDNRPFGISMPNSEWGMGLGIDQAGEAINGAPTKHIKPCGQESKGDPYCVEMPK